MLIKPLTVHNSLIQFAKIRGINARMLSQPLTPAITERTLAKYNITKFNLPKSLTIKPDLKNHLTVTFNEKGVYTFTTKACTFQPSIHFSSTLWKTNEALPQYINAPRNKFSIETPVEEGAENVSLPYNPAEGALGRIHMLGDLHQLEENQSIQMFCFLRALPSDLASQDLTYCEQTGQIFINRDNFDTSSICTQIIDYHLPTSQRWVKLDDLFAELDFETATQVCRVSSFVESALTLGELL